MEFENLGEALKKFAASLREINITVAAAKDAEGLIKQRIFNEGKAASGRMLGKYKSKSWKEKRKKKGRQVAYRDFEYTGDLRRSIKTGTRGDKAATVEIAGQEQIDKANKLTRIAGGDVFVLNEAEADEVIKRAEKHIDKEIDKLFDKYF